MTLRLALLCTFEEDMVPLLHSLTSAARQYAACAREGRSTVNPWCRCVVLAQKVAWCLRDWQPFSLDIADLTDSLALLALVRAAVRMADTADAGNGAGFKAAKEQFQTAALTWS